MASSRNGIVATLLNISNDGNRYDNTPTAELRLGSQLGQPTYDAILNLALEAVQRKVQVEELALHQLQKASASSLVTEPSGDASSHLHQLRIIKSAYESLASVEPDLQFADSPVPALLALRNSHGVVEATKTGIANTAEKVIEAQKQLSKEQSDLRDSQMISSALARRIESLLHNEGHPYNGSVDHSANALLKRLQDQNKAYERAIKGLIRAFNQFIDNYLAPMLENEELGGPVVGELIGIDPNVLDSDSEEDNETHRKATKHRKDPKQRRIVDMLEPVSAKEHEGNRTAGPEMRALTEELLNASVIAGGHSSSAYVKLERDSAAARFLVRAKVAQFHPKDATRLRLVDFGRRLDD